jgi:hypothetical protein
VDYNAVKWFDFDHPSLVGQALFKMTPFRPEVTHLLSVRTWADLEIFFALSVIILSFSQKKYDHFYATGSLIALMDYVSLVVKTTYAFAVLLDGVYVHVHAATDEGRPIATIALMIISTQQIKNLMARMATSRIVTSMTVATLPNEIVSTRRKADSPPLWALILIDTQSVIGDAGHWARGFVSGHSRQQ